MRRLAEDANYFDTTVHPAKSLGEIQEMLEEFGASAQVVTQGQASGRFAWLIRFQWEGRSYHFVFTPLDCQYPNAVHSFGGKKRTHAEQARWQMGRIATWFVKAILTAAEADPLALFGFLELPGMNHVGAIPPTTGELDVDGLTANLPDIEIYPRLPGGDG